MTLQPPLEGLVDYRLSDGTRIVQSLAGFRRQWQEAVGQQSLLEIEAPVGMILADIIDKLNLTPQERHTILGGKLSNQVNAMMEERVDLKLA